MLVQNKTFLDNSGESKLGEIKVSTVFGYQVRFEFDINSVPDISTIADFSPKIREKEIVVSFPLHDVKKISDFLKKLEALNLISSNFKKKISDNFPNGHDGTMKLDAVAPGYRAGLTTLEHVLKTTLGPAGAVSSLPTPMEAANRSFYAHLQSQSAFLSQKKNDIPHSSSQITSMVQPTSDHYALLSSALLSSAIFNAGVSSSHQENAEIEEEIRDAEEAPEELAVLANDVKSFLKDLSQGRSSFRGTRNVRNRLISHSVTSEEGEQKKSSLSGAEQSTPNPDVSRQAVSSDSTIVNSTIINVPVEPCPSPQWWFGIELPYSLEREHHLLGPKEIPYDLTFFSSSPDRVSLAPVPHDEEMESQLPDKTLTEENLSSLSSQRSLRK